MSNAENFDRRGRYDPNEPLLVRYADVIAAQRVAGVQALDTDYPGADHTPGVYSYGKSWLVTGQPFTAPPTTLATR